jgi:hypothetical protein
MGKTKGRGRGVPFDQHADVKAAALEQQRKNDEEDAAAREKHAVDRARYREAVAKREAEWMTKRAAMTPAQVAAEAAEIGHAQRGLAAMCTVVEQGERRAAGQPVWATKRGCSGSLDVMSEGGAAGPRGGAAGPRGGPAPMTVNNFTTAFRMMSQKPTQTAEDLAHTDGRRSCPHHRNNHGQEGEASGSPQHSDPRTPQSCRRFRGRDQHGGHEHVCAERGQQSQPQPDREAVGRPVAIAVPRDDRILPGLGNGPPPRAPDHHASQVLVIPHPPELAEVSSLKCLK